MILATTGVVVLPSPPRLYFGLSSHSKMNPKKEVYSEVLREHEVSPRTPELSPNANIVLRLPHPSPAEALCVFIHARQTGQCSCMRGELVCATASPDFCLGCGCKGKMCITRCTMPMIFYLCSAVAGHWPTPWSILGPSMVQNTFRIFE